MVEQPANQPNAHYIGAYQITGPLGEGGFGKVYGAYQPFLDRQVAIKTVRPELLDLLEQPAAVSERLFINEGRAIARLRHPNIVVVYEFGVAQDSLTNQRIAYMVMEYLPGPSLSDRLTKESIPLDKSIGWIEQIADGLTYAHEQNVIHRDLKPSNVLFSAAGQPVIVDFGLSWLMEDKRPELPGNDGAKPSTKPTERHPGASTLNTNTIGTPKYMAPEQVSGGAASPATDQFSLGLIAYELLGGSVPFDTSNLAEALIHRANQPIPSILSQRPQLPVAVDQVLQRALALDPAARYPNAKAFAEAFGDALQPDRRRPKVVQVLDPIQAARLQMARRYASGALTVFGLFVLLVILFCTSVYIRGYNSGSQPDFVWDGLIFPVLRQADGYRLIVGVMPGSVAEAAGYRAGDEIEDDLSLDQNNPNGQYLVNAVPRASLSIDWQPQPGDVIERQVKRKNETLTLSYTLERNPYALVILAVTLFAALIMVASGFWLLRRWGAEPGIQIGVPLSFLFGAFIVARAVTHLILFLDTLTFHLTLAVALHLIVSTPVEPAWLKRHPWRIGLIYAPVSVGLYYFLFQTRIVVPAINVPLQVFTYFGYILAIAVFLVKKWLRHEGRHYPGIRWLLFGGACAVIMTFIYIVVAYLIPSNVLVASLFAGPLQKLTNDCLLTVITPVIAVLAAVGVDRLQSQLSTTETRVLRTTA